MKTSFLSLLKRQKAIRRQESRGNGSVPKNGLGESTVGGNRVVESENEESGFIHGVGSQKLTEPVPRAIEQVFEFSQKTLLGNPSTSVAIGTIPHIFYLPVLKD